MPFANLFSQWGPQAQAQNGGHNVEAAQAHILKAQELVNEGKLEQAIVQFSLALRAQLSKQQEQEVLLQRGRTYARLSEQLRKIPAAHSESHALYFYDPTQLAKFAHKDATRGLSIEPPQPEFHLLQAKACILLEQYAAAEAAALDGLSLDPTHTELQAMLQQATAVLATTSATASTSSSLSRRHVLARIDDVECTLCLKLLYEPVTTSCGHTFCKPCFQRARDHGSRCPMCRTILHIGGDLPITVCLKNILEKSFPQEYAERRAEELAETSTESAVSAPLPLFVMACLMPGQRMALNMFEPRYRLMVRRCMEGNRRFGMATVSSSHRLDNVACVAEILDCQPTQDGRYLLELIGRERFRITEAWELDGYRMARPEYFTDLPVPSEQKHTLAELCAHVESLADQFVDRLRAMVQAGSRDYAIHERLEAAQNKPAPRPSSPSGADLPEIMSFWIANILPLDMRKRLRLLEMTSTRERLEFTQNLMQSSSQYGCAMQ